MRPLLHPHLVNGRTGDPALYVEMLFGGGALLFDLGELTLLPTRQMLKLSHVLVTHMHMDHFIGFDRLLRLMVGRDKRIDMVGPPGFADRVWHRLQGYSWDLVHRYAVDLVFVVREVGADGVERAARFRFKTGFGFEEVMPEPAEPGYVLSAPGFRVAATMLEHHGPCLGYAVEEPAHVNIWRNKLDEMGLPTGQWLQALKRAVAEHQADDTPIAIDATRSLPLAALRQAVSVTPGQKIAYVTDIADTPGNRAKVAALARGADRLYIEASFAADDAALAADRAHLTTTAAGEMARAAGVRRVEPFHFSPRYEGREAAMIAEVEAAFAGQPMACGIPAK